MILISLPLQDFDPSEAAIPWLILTRAGFKVHFATPDGQTAQGDSRMLTGEGLGIWKPLLQAQRNAIEAYQEMVQDPLFLQPMTYDAIQIQDYQALLFPGGHAPGMKPYLESTILQAKIAEAFEHRQLIAAVCHGVVLVARSISPSTGKSVLHGRKTTSLLKKQELLAWRLTQKRLGNYYRTYPETTVEDEVRAVLANSQDFQSGPLPLARDSQRNLKAGFVCQDQNYLSARWPGDAHQLGIQLLKKLK